MLAAPYEDMMKILEECAKEKGISPKLIKKIYDLERDQSHLSYRNNEIKLRQDIIESMKEEQNENT